MSVPTSLEPDVVDASGRGSSAPRTARRRPRAVGVAGVAAALGALVAGVGTGTALAGGEVSQVLIDELPATPFRYSVDGRTYTWGLGTNQTMRGFVAAGIEYGYADTAARVELRRDDIGDVATGNPCGVFVQRLDAAGESLAADYPSDGSGTGECDVAELLSSRIVNRGALDLFSNVAPDAKNIERVDFVFDHGVLAPFVDGGRERAGHVVGEKRGNNPVRIAAILELDVFGQPAGYGPLVQVDAKHCAPERLCYGETDLVHEYAFFQNERRVPQGFPVETELSVETVAMAFVDLHRLGLHAGQRYHGFSLFADDVDRNAHVLTDPATFPNDTSDPEISSGDDADVHGGLAGYFVADELSVASGRVYLDEDDDGAFGDGDAGLPGIGVRLYADTNADGAFDPLVDEPLCDPIDSDGRGLFVLPGLADGDYFVVLHEGDPDIPGGLAIVPGTNPRPVHVRGGDVEGVDFPFSNGDAPVDGGDGSDDGGTDGASDAGDGGNGDGGTTGTGDGEAGDGNGGGQGGDSGEGAGTGAADGTDAGTGTDDSGTTGAGDGSGDGGADGASDAGTGGDDAGDDDGQGDDPGEGTGTGDGADAGTDAGATSAGDGADDAGATGGATGGDAGADTGGTDTAGSGEGGAGDGGAGVTDGDGSTGGNGAGTDGGTGGGTDGGGTVIGAPDADDSSTNAVADSATTPQGRPVTIDVLANDTDASGAGLEILGTTGSPDATVTIEEDPDGAQTLLYVPDFGFFGDDAFAYTIVDGDGTEATGTVLVSVTRFSDIDGNGLNDFDECDCADLTLETGVNGSGIGGASVAGLAGLAGLLLLGGGRRRVRRPGARTGAPA